MKPRSSKPEIKVSDRGFEHFKLENVEGQPLYVNQSAIIDDTRRGMNNPGSSYLRFSFGKEGDPSVRLPRSEVYHLMEALQNWITYNSFQGILPVNPLPADGKMAVAEAVYVDCMPNEDFHAFILESGHKDMSILVIESSEDISTRLINDTELDVVLTNYLSKERPCSTPTSTVPTRKRITRTPTSTKGRAASRKKK